MFSCPQCKEGKMALHKTKVYYQCKSCSHVEYDEKLSLDLPKSFDFSKLEVLGAYYLPTSSFSSFSVILLKYGRTLLYVPPMSLNELKELSEELFQLVEKWCPFSFTFRDFKEDSDFSSVYYNRTNKLLPRYESNKKTEKIYNILTYSNRLHAKKYHIVYSLQEKDNRSHVGEHVFQKNECVEVSVNVFEKYRYVVSSKNHSHTIFDLIRNETFRVDNLERIVKVTKDYIVGWNSKDRDDHSIFLYKAIRKTDGKILYQDNKGHDSGYRLIGNRYFVTVCYQDGILDLLTGEKIQYPFENTCSNFVCDVNESGFTDSKGRHPLKDFPDAKWSRYDRDTFLKKFSGFIPHKDRVGRTWLDGTGGYEMHDRSIFVFKGIKEGLFYKKSKKLINLLTEQEIDVDDVMMNWIEKNEKVHIFDKKPKNDKRFSILEALYNGKKIDGLRFKFGRLRYGNDNKMLKTNFLKNEISFASDNIQDVIYNHGNRKPTFEIICKVDNKKVTFETDNEFEHFEVADIA